MILVFFICALLLINASMVILSKNPIYSVLFLVASFLCSSILLFLFDSEFLALFFLIIYLGAIAILFLFVVMMLDIKYKNFRISQLYLPLASFIGFVLLIEICGALLKVFSKNRNTLEHNFNFNWYDSLDAFLDIDIFGQVFYTHYVLQILMAGFILYLAIIGVTFLTVKSAFTKSKKQEQSLFRQLSRKNVL